MFFVYSIYIHVLNYDASPLQLRSLKAPKLQFGELHMVIFNVHRMITNVNFENLLG